jgi:two-component system LytT family sensor kinase
VRFGTRLKVVKQIEPDSLDVVVPSMILQPLVENSLRHGLAPKVGPGELVLRSHRSPGHTVIEVIDNGLGMSPTSGGTLDEASGIGLRNVNERLRVIYGANYRLQLESVPGQGTRARIEIPEAVITERITA